jgi:hypothetical protein
LMRPKRLEMRTRVPRLPRGHRNTHLMILANTLLCAFKSAREQFKG